jgi:N-acetylglucosamine-6-phosphate deacetylase
VSGNRAVLSRGGSIAGSVTDLMKCLTVAVSEMKIPLYSAVKCATVNPARAIGAFGEIGSLAPGNFSDIVLLDEGLRIVAIVLRGKFLGESAVLNMT